MIHRQKRLATLLLLAAYLCASTLGGVLHSHDHGSSQDEPKSALGQQPVAPHEHAGHAHANHQHHGHSHACHQHAEHRNERTNPAGQEHDPTPADHGHDDCTVCQFLSQVTLPVEIVAAEMLVGACDDSPLLDVDAPAYGVLRATLHLRAGPAV